MGNYNNANSSRFADYGSNGGIKRYLTAIVFILLLTIGYTACDSNRVPNQPSPISDASQTGSSGKVEIERVSVGPGIFRSDEFYLQVDLPTGWVAAEGPEFLLKSLEGQVAFNSWGQEDLWVREVRTEHPDGTTSYTYRPHDVMSQIPEGGAYISLLRIWGPPPPPEDYEPPDEYATSDLSRLNQPHDWRQDTTAAQFKEFHKWGRYLMVLIACHPDASDETVAHLNDLLQSWRFDAVPAGDTEWAGIQARKLLPEVVEPMKFKNRSGRIGNRVTQLEVQGDTVRVKFMYHLKEPPEGPAHIYECPDKSCHWWKIDVLPTGESVLVDEGGAPLPLR